MSQWPQFLLHRERGVSKQFKRSGLCISEMCTMWQWIFFSRSNPFVPITALASGLNSARPLFFVGQKEEVDIAGLNPRLMSFSIGQIMERKDAPTTASPLRPPVAVITAPFVHREKTKAAPKLRRPRPKIFLVLARVFNLSKEGQILPYGPISNFPSNILIFLVSERCCIVRYARMLFKYPVALPSLEIGYFLGYEAGSLKCAIFDQNF